MKTFTQTWGLTFKVPSLQLHVPQWLRRLSQGIQYLLKVAIRIFDFFFSTEIVREQGPGQRPLARHEWNNQHNSNHNRWVL